MKQQQKQKIHNTQNKSILRKKVQQMANLKTLALILFGVLLFSTGVHSLTSNMKTRGRNMMKQIVGSELQAVSANQAAEESSFNSVNAVNSGLGVGPLGLGGGVSAVQAVSAQQAAEASSFNSVQAANVGVGLGGWGVPYGVGFGGYPYGIGYGYPGVLGYPGFYGGCGF